LRNSSSLSPSGTLRRAVRAKHLDTRERLAFETAHKLFDVDAEVSERLRHVAHDTWPLVGDDLERDEARRLFGLCRRRRARSRRAGLKARASPALIRAE